jgi:hypothetical protein
MKDRVRLVSKLSEHEWNELVNDFNFDLIKCENFGDPPFAIVVLSKKEYRRLNKILEPERYPSCEARET